MAAKISDELHALSQALTRADRRLVLPQEGGLSGKLDSKSFLFQKRLTHQVHFEEPEFQTAYFGPLLDLIDRKPNAGTPLVREVLQSALSAGESLPGREIFYHAQLLDLPNIRFVAHTLPAALQGILVSPRAEAFAALRITPEQVLVCGPKSLYVPYMDSGLAIAAELRYRLDGYLNQFGEAPRCVLIAHIGLITLGYSADDVLQRTLSMHKAAEIYLAAQACGGAEALSELQIQRLLNP